jgi:hypothetical protein
MKPQNNPLTYYLTPLTLLFERSKRMKRNLLLLAVMTVLVLSFTWHSVAAQCPEDPNDLGICDTLYVETFDGDQIYPAGAGYDSVRVPIYVTHDSNTFWWSGGNKWVQDSIAAFAIPLSFWKSGCADSIIFPTYGDWNSKIMDPNSAKFNRSMFRHLVDPETGDTIYNRFALMHEAGLADWTVNTNIVSHDPGHVFLSMVILWPNSREWWEGSKELLATMTFLVYMEDSCSSTTICLDSTFWPPSNRLAFCRYDAATYIPRHFLPVCDTIWVPHPIAEIVLPNDSALVYDTVQVILGDRRGEMEPITRALFEYSPNCINWYYIGEDSDGTATQGSTWGPDTLFGDGWSGYWATNSLSAGWYFLRGTFYTESGWISSDTISLYVDPRPAIPTIVSPEFGGYVEDSVAILVSLRDTSGIDSVVFQEEEAPEEYEKGMPEVDQGDKPQCGQYSAGSCIIHWAKKFKGLRKPPGNPNGQDLTNEAIIEELVGTEKKPGRIGVGPADVNKIVQGIKDYIDARADCRGKLELGTKKDPKFDDYKRELEKNDQAVILFLWDPVGKRGHYVVGNSVKDKPDENGKRYIDVMDPAHGWIDYEIDWTDHQGGPSLIKYSPDDPNPDPPTYWEVQYLIHISEPGKQHDCLMLLAPSIPKCRLFPPIPGEFVCKFSTEDMPPATLWFVDVQVYKTLSGYQRVYGDYTLIAKFLRGDVTGDGVIDASDVVYLINYLFINGPAPMPLQAGDVNSDGVVDVSDVVYLINYLFVGGPSPSAPISPGNGLELYKGKAPAQIGFSSPTISKDGIFNLPVVGKFDSDLAGVQLEIKYDPEKLTLLEPTLTSRTEGLSIYSSSKEGIQRIGILDLNGEHHIPAGNGALVNLRMKGSDLTGLEITKAILVDRDARKIPVQIVARMKESEEEFGGEKTVIPQEFSLSQNYPNPFNPETEISYGLPRDCYVRLVIYNIAGQKVNTLVDEHQSAGYKTVSWNGEDDRGKKVASGIYFYKLEAGDFRESRKMVLIK